jgi:hypothetical protein
MKIRKQAEETQVFPTEINHKVQIDAKFEGEVSC